MKKQIIDNYAINLKFLHQLSAGFGFRVYSFYQPIGLLDQDNPFVGNQAQKARGYVVEMDRVIREAIASGRLPMIDISQTLRAIRGQKYVDVAHYSPLANKVLAKKMLLHMFATSAWKGANELQQAPAHD